MSFSDQIRDRKKLVTAETDLKTKYMYLATLKKLVVNSVTKHFIDQ